MGSRLEEQGKVRKVKVKAWAVYVSPSQMDHYAVELCAGGEEVLQEVVSSQPFEIVEVDGTKRTGTRRVYEEKWLPEAFQRIFLRGIPEPLYRAQDVERLRSSPNFQILKSAKAVKAFKAARKLEAEQELKIAEAKRFEREKKLLAERETFLARIQGREEP